MANREKRLLREIQAERQRAIIDRAFKQTSEKNFLLRSAGLSNSSLAETLLKSAPN